MPSANCRIEVIGELSQERYAAFTLLYYPLIGADAALLYHTLLAIGTRKQKIKNHLLIEKICGLSRAVIEKNRRILEQYLLMKTYYNTSENAYVYSIFMPKDGSSFLRHEIFGRLYLKKMGKQVYEFTKLCFADDVIEKTGYQEITLPFENILKDDWEDDEEKKFQKLKPEDRKYALDSDIPLSFNYDVFLTGCSKSIFPLSARNEENLRLIGELATIHGISEKDMRKLVSQSMDLKINKLDKEKLKRKARNAHVSVKVNVDEENPYGIPPVAFLQRRQPGVPVNAMDKEIIERLMSIYRMHPEVVNVLIEYVLENNNQKLVKSYVEKIASQWVRLKIDTSEKAIAHIKQDKNEYKGYGKKKKVLPEWFHQEDTSSNQEEQVVSVDDEQLEAMMAKLRGEQ